MARGGTALVQGAVATVGYVAIGIPRALLLGPLTSLCAIVPLVGTALVWVPLAVELGATGQYWRAGVVVAVGAGVHSLVDNFIRPLFARYGRLTLPTFVVRSAASRRSARQERCWDRSWCAFVPNRLQ